MRILHTHRPHGAVRALAATAALLLASASALLGATTAAGADEGGASWSVDTLDGERGQGRPNFSYAVDPGTTISDSMRVTNTGSTPLSLKVYAADASTTSSGAIDILPAGEPSTDAGAWVVPAADTIQLEPGAVSDIAFTITVPADATPGDHSAALVASLAASGDGQVQVERRLGLRVSLRVSGELTPALQIAEVRTGFAAGLNPFDPGVVRVEYDLTNTGNVRLIGSDDVRLSGALGLAPSGLIGTEVPELLPGSTITLVREVPSSAIGPLTGTITVLTTSVTDSGAAPATATAEISVIATPWALIVLILIVLAAIVIAIVVIVRRRRRRMLEELLAEEQSLLADAEAAAHPQPLVSSAVKAER